MHHAPAHLPLFAIGKIVEIMTTLFQDRYLLQSLAICSGMTNALPLTSRSIPLECNFVCKIPAISACIQRRTGIRAH